MDIDGSLQQVMNQLASFSNKSIEERLELEAVVSKMMAKYQDGTYHLDLRNPDYFNFMVTEEVLPLLEGLFYQTYFTKMDSARFYKLQFIYTNYQFIENQLSKLLERTEGVPCSLDKTKWLINSRIREIFVGEVPDLKEEWYKPKHAEMWFRLFDSLSDLYYGSPDSYVEVLQEILKTY